MPAGIARAHQRYALSRGAWLLLAVCGCTEPHFEKDGGGETEADAEGAERPIDAEPGSEAAACEADACDAAVGPGARECDDSACDGAAAIDPTGALDGAASDTGSRDARLDEAGEVAAPVDAGLDPVRARWAGRYATRSFVFSYDEPARVSASYLTVAEIAPSADGGLTLTEELCRFQSEFWLGVTAHHVVDFPAGVRLSADVVYDSEHFSSTLGSAYVGYGPAPAGCAAGQTLSVSDGRPWLSNGTCDCPSNGAPPSSTRDCRVIDSDGDMQPGNTFEVTVDSTIGVFRATQEHHLRFVNGYRDGERLYAQREFGDVTSVFSCTIGGKPARLDQCELGTDGPCPAMFNQAELRRIEPQQGCDQVRERESAWFETPAPVFPGGCLAVVGP